MSIERIAELLDGKVLASAGQEINSFYAGDFLSHVIAGAPSGCGWLTIMNNINVAGVAVMADIKLIIICEKVNPISELIAKCKEEGIAVVASPMPIFDCAAALSKHL